MPYGGTRTRRTPSPSSQGRAGIRRINQATRSYPHIPVRVPSLHELKRTPGTAQYAKRQSNIARREVNRTLVHHLPRLSPTLGALHALTRHDLIDAASSTDSALRDLLPHLASHGSTDLSSSENERQLRKLAKQQPSRRIPELNPKRVGVTLARSGRQIQTPASVAHALGGNRGYAPSSRKAGGGTDLSKAERSQRRVLTDLIQKPHKTEAEVKAVGDLLREYHPKQYRNIQAAYLIHKEKKSGEIPTTKPIPGVPVLKQTKRGQRRYLKTYEQTAREREINKQAELGNITHPDMPHGLVAFLGDLIPDTPAEIAAAAAGGYLIRGAGGALIRAGTRAAGRRAVEGASAIAGKGLGKVANVADRAILSAAARSPKADRALYGAARAGEKAAPKVRAGLKGARVAAKPVSIPARYAGRHPGQSALGVNVGPGVVAAAQSGHPNAAIAPLEGYYQALTQHPGKVAGTTLRSVPSLVTTPIGIAANLGKSVVTADPHPIEQQTKDIADFGIGMAKTFASGDPNKIQKAIESQYGLTPLIMAGIPGTKLLARAGVDDAVGSALRKVPGIRKGLEAQGRLRGNRASRYNVAKAVAYARRNAHNEIMGRTGRNAVPGLSTISENLRGTENKRGTVKRSGQKITDEHLVKTLAEQGLTKPEHIQQFVSRHGVRHPEAPANRITNADVAAHLAENPHRLNDQQLTAAVHEYRRMQKEQGYETSAVAKYLPMGVTWGVKLPWDRFLTERAALGEIKAKDELARQTGMSRNEATANARQLHPDLMGLDAGAKATLRKRLEDKGRSDFVKETQAVQQKHGLAEPAWTSDSNVLARGDQGIGVGNVRGYRGRASFNVSRQTRGALQGMGLSDQSWEALVQHSVVSPRMSKAINESTAQLMETEAKPVPLGPDGARIRVLTEKQARKGIRDGLIDPERELLLDSQSFKSALLDPRVPDSQKFGKGMMQSLADETRQFLATKSAGVKGMKGRTFVVLDRAKADEFLKQHFGVHDRNAVQASQHYASRAILGYSPAWLAAQPIAEGAQGLAAVGIVNQLRGAYQYHRMTPQEKLDFDSVMGTTSGTADIQTAASTLHEPDSPSSATRLGRALQRSTTGRITHGVLTGRYASAIDRTKGLAIRRTVAAGHLTREYDKFTAGLGNIMGEAERLKGMSRDQVMRHFSTDPGARAKLESYVDDTMGNWTALTHRERKAAGWLIFYPFLRMSLSWVAKSYPSRHPFKASILHFLAQENANKLAGLTGGGPSFFPQWASAPLYDSKGKASQLIPLQRVAPGSNTVLEAIGSGGGSVFNNLARALNPIVGAGLSAWSGTDPLSGRSLVEHGQEVPDTLKGRLFAAQLANLPAPARLADALLTGGKATRAIEGKPETPTSRLYAKVGESAERKAIRSFLLPLLPTDTDKVAIQARIGRLLSDKYGKDSEKASRAAGELAALYSKYGVPQSASSSSDAFSHLFGSGSSSSSSDPFSHLFK